MEKLNRSRGDAVPPDENTHKVRTPRQQIHRSVALAALARGLSICAAAAAAGVNEKAVRKYLKEPEFQAELAPLLSSSIEDAIRQIDGSLAAVAEAGVGIATGKTKGTPWQVAMIRDLLNRKKIGAGERLEVGGEFAELSNEALEQLARGD
jgi:hypothetical protein